MATTTDTATNTATTTADAVRREQVRTLYSQTVPILFANVSIAIITGFALAPTHPPLQLVGWLSLVLAVTLGRLELWRRYRRAPLPAHQMNSWGMRFVAGSIASGLVWGAAVIFFAQERGELPGILLTLTLAGLVAGAAGTLSCFMPAFWGFMIPALLPLLVRNASIRDSLHMTLAAMVAIFGTVLTVVARNTNRALTEAFSLRFENEALLGRLSHAQLSLEDTNRTLEIRVNERTATLERQSEALRKAQQLESVGRLAGGIAHDFNNLLTVILANVTLLLREAGLREEVRAPLTEVAGAAERGAALVRQLLAFGRQQRLEPRVLDVNQVVATLESILIRLIGERVRIVVEPAAGRALVRADRGQLEQVIINLVTNARDAMPDGGTLTIATGVIEESMHNDAPVSRGAFVELSVSDTGTGMDAETQRHVFEPFFTTKEQGKGTGLGLATVYGVVEQSGGHVLVESTPRAGSVFRIHLPRASEEEGPLEPSPQADHGQARRATILLAEDDAQVRAAMERVLSQAGHEVLLAASGEAALAVSRAHGGPIHVLITDVVMPGMGGPELARQLCGERPALRVLFVSGYHQEDALSTGSVNYQHEYLQKPLTFDVLERKLAALLEPERSTGC